MPETMNISLRGGDIEAVVLKDGSGPPLLYLHGAVGQKGWAPFLGALAKQFTVYAPYLPGYGKSNGLDKLDDVTDLTLHHFELLDALGVAKAHVVGHFLGGMIAAEMAALSPSYVDRLVLAAPAGTWRDSEPVADLLSMTANQLQDNLWSSASSSMSLSPADFEANSRLKAELAADRMQDLTAAGKFLWPIPDRGLKRRAYRIKAPTLVLWGENDRIIPPVYAEDFTRLISGAQVSVIPNAGHLLMIERAEVFAASVADFLS
ncbi:MAG: alpha/beta fold hydrolase [Chloroflexi bacterium]|nr:alpha/beta fold hydrolase [Chloroflexota bacterium]MDA1271513.1 alpha/beta fold hydrolase [Chloroflexota bacterium]